MTQSAFDLSAFKKNLSDSSKDIVYLARTAEAAERYEDMCQFMKELVLWADKQEPKHNLSSDERNLLSVAYKNVIGARRASWRTLTGVKDPSSDSAELVQEYQKQVEAELKEICEEILALLDNHLISNKGNESEAQVFYLKMAGDYYRYMAESVPDDENDKKAADFYRQAYQIAKVQLAATHPIRLGLALNYSVCYFEILKNKEKACELAKQAFDDAISKLDKLAEDDYKDSTLIMQLLRDNLTLWTNEQGDDADDVQVEDLGD
jgi:hypothetical protein